MSTAYQVILGLWLLNWAISFVLYDRDVSLAKLGSWVFFVCVTQFAALRSIEGEITGWKHNVLAVYMLVGAVSGTINIFSSATVRLKANHIVAAFIMAPVFLWLLFTG